MANITSDIVIVGSGFGGSLLGWILCRQGQRVTLIDRAYHPRFAIGESSTPLADFLLEQIAHEFSLPQLQSLSRWGKWRRELPEVRCGKKRGFSYYAHRTDQPFHEAQEHEHSWLVAASANDELSDTHWMRSDVDQWLCEQARNAGVEILEGVSIEQLENTSAGWKITGFQQPREGNGDASQSGLSPCPSMCSASGTTRQAVELRCPMLVDATGAGNLLGQHLGLASREQELNTRTSALFGHFTHVGSMTSWLRQHGYSTENDPFDGDDAAQHHLLEGGWMWMLRFLDGTTSVVLVQPQIGSLITAENIHGTSNTSQTISKVTSRTLQRSPTNVSAQRLWQRTVSRYPTLADLLRNSRLVGPVQSGRPSLSIFQNVSRLWSTAAGPNWAMLPTTAGVVDPLHSTGIAHNLSGVLRLARILSASDANETEKGISLTERRLLEYSRNVVDEVLWIDRLVSLSYLGMQLGFESFQLASAFYFMVAIHSERGMAANRTPATATQPARGGTGADYRDGFLLCGNQYLATAIAESRRDLTRMHQVCQQQCRSTGVVPDALKETAVAIHESIRKRLSRWDDVGLLQPPIPNRVARSAAPK